MVQIICECGIVIAGTSEKHARANLKQHKKTKEHKLQLRYLEKHKFDEAEEAWAQENFCN